MEKDGVRARDNRFDTHELTHLVFEFLDLRIAFGWILRIPSMCLTRPVAGPISSSLLSAVILTFPP
jgi:hypothetical protein